MIPIRRRLGLRRTLGGFLILGLFAGASARAADDPFWPQFHGPNRDNISTETGLLKRWPDSGPPLLWTARGIGQGYSSLCLAHGLIFTAGSIGGHTVVTALDLGGTVQWQRQNGPAWCGNRRRPKFPRPGFRLGS